MHLRSVLLVFGSALLMEVSDGIINSAKLDSSNSYMIFPQEPGTAYVKVTPIKDTNFTALTLCVRALTDLWKNYSIFSYSTSSGKNDLLLVRKSVGEYQVHIGGNAVTFDALDGLQIWNYVCITWDSSTGLVGLWVNGRRLVRKVLSKGYTIQPGGVTILGKEQDKLEGGTDNVQSYVGELNCVNQWDYVLPPFKIRDSKYGGCELSGNVIGWGTLNYVAVGYVVVVKNED
ncbi:mucosal pentraxin-like [Protopterus annectens]|uniref:mucosal pentraxin-like n=1 Tax=Protopterus annectens TaxID=7888 RepID=UPI001CFA98D7|nr:mucosal pentraxin-like [Protopterus annectens]